MEQKRLFHEKGMPTIACRLAVICHRLYTNLPKVEHNSANGFALLCHNVGKCNKTA